MTNTDTDKTTFTADPVVMAVIDHILDTWDESMFGDCPTITACREDGTVSINKYPGGPGVEITIRNIHPSTVDLAEYDIETGERLA